MRTLVEQTERAVSEWISKAELNSRVKVHVLMGGLSPSDWHLEPEREAVLIGAQDMLISRALNRGYAMSGAGGIRAFNMRGRWRIKRAAQPRGGADKGERDGRD